MPADYCASPAPPTSVPSVPSPTPPPGLSATSRMIEQMLNVRDCRIAALEQRVVDLEQQLARAVGQRVIEGQETNANQTR